MSWAFSSFFIPDGWNSNIFQPCKSFGSSSWLILWQLTVRTCSLECSRSLQWTPIDFFLCSSLKLQLLLLPQSLISVQWDHSALEFPSLHPSSESTTKRKQGIMGLALFLSLLSGITVLAVWRPMFENSCLLHFFQLNSCLWWQSLSSNSFSVMAEYCFWLHWIVFILLHSSVKYQLSCCQFPGRVNKF